MEQPSFKDLLDDYITGTISAEGKLQLSALLDQPAYLEELERRMEESFLSDQFLGEENPQIHSAIHNFLKEKIEEQKTRASVIPFFRKYRWKIAVAACIVLLLGIGSYLVLPHKQDTHNRAQQPHLPIDVKAPQLSRATITLSSGEKLYLDSTRRGQFALQGKVKLVKLPSGEIAYQVEKAGTGGELIYNTLTNPRGSQITTITLADGTRVWLNAGSSITYPVAFVSSERRVSITGEVYFEVTHNPHSPFKVGLPPAATGESKGEITVLGTHFNVQAYGDEPQLKVTLLEGSVKVSAKAQSLTIRPGQQVLIPSSATDQRGLTVQSSVDLQEVMAWKEGRFSFNRADIQTVMRELARWYDLDVAYEGAPTTDLFGGDIQRDLPLSKTLDFLRKSQVHFEVRGRKVIVKK